jgi:hypothetical protein
MLRELLHSPRGLDVKVDYYDQREADCFRSRYQNAAAIDRLAGKTVTIPVAEFLTYCLFVNKRPELPRLASYSAIKATLEDRLADFDDGLEITTRSLRTRLTGNDQLSDLSHKIGTGIALSVTNRLTWLNEADWNRMSVTSAKAEDFWFASQRTGHVHVEAKGSSVVDHSQAKPVTVRHHATSIRGKFEESAKRDGNFPVTRYGVIGSVDQRPDSVMQSWLVDPPEGALNRAPRDQQILNRLSFVAEVLAAMRGIDAITLEIYRRIAELAQTDDVAAYQGHALPGSGSSWIESLLHLLPHDRDRTFFGTILRLKDGMQLFYGIKTDWIKAVHAQNFEALLALDFRPTSEELRIEVPAGFQVPPREEKRAKGTKQDYDRKPLSEGLFHTASSGRVFGVVGA